MKQFKSPVITSKCRRQLFNNVPPAVLESCSLLPSTRLTGFSSETIIFRVYEAIKNLRGAAKRNPLINGLNFINQSFNWFWGNLLDRKQGIRETRGGWSWLKEFTFDDMHNDPVRSGVGGDTGVVATMIRCRVSNSEPALQHRTNNLKLNLHPDFTLKTENLIPFIQFNLAQKVSFETQHQDEVIWVVQDECPHYLHQWSYYRMAKIKSAESL